ncbi:MAG: type II site-specific deoxyribonuclease [Kiritimatiellae bacterium]|nr:type II site-specific deoxyribonuclease [Kiritimatiellia bacterium]
MAKAMPYVLCPQDLVTTQEARRDGFLAIALRRDVESTPYIDQGKALWAQLNATTKCCGDVLKMPELQSELLLAAGYSVKAQGNMDDDDKTRLLEEFIKRVIGPVGRKYVDEIVYRYLLALGEQLGGRMRNAIGVMAREKLSQKVAAQLRLRHLPFAVCGGKGEWIDGLECSVADVSAAKAIKWANGEYVRMLVHNVNVPGVSKNVDFVVFNKFSNALDAKSLAPILADQKNYVVMGELKGGIDPAGADEHWKTARAALDRIRATFKKVYIAFVGAAIEKAMAEEIYTQLQSGLLDYAANLTDDNQVLSFCDWLVNQ